MWPVHGCQCGGDRATVEATATALSKAEPIVHALLKGSGYRWAALSDSSFHFFHDHSHFLILGSTRGQRLSSEYLLGSGLARLGLAPSSAAEPLPTRCSLAKALASGAECTSSCSCTQALRSESEDLRAVWPRMAPMRTITNKMLRRLARVRAMWPLTPPTARAKVEGDAAAATLRFVDNEQSEC